MKVITIIILFQVWQAKASFYDDFRGAMSSVENAFGKLLNDVVTDVKSTVHCTILAMQDVLAMNGVMSKPIPSKECYGEGNKNNFEIDTGKKNRDSYSAKDIAQEISTSISKVNDTLNRVLDNDGHERLQDIQNTLKNESDRLKEVSLLLRQELEKISHRMKREFHTYSNIDSDSDKSSLESIWNNMKDLYELEKNNTNVSEVNEIKQVFNKALNVLQINTVTEVKSDEDKIKAIMRKLEHERNITNTPQTTINRELSSEREEDQFRLDNKLGHQEIPEGTPKSFKEVATKMFKHSNTIKKEVDDYIIDKSSNFVNNKELNEESEITNVETETRNRDTDEYSEFDESNNEDSIEKIDQAMDIIRNSAETQKLLDEFFAKGEKGANAFENPDLLNN